MINLAPPYYICYEYGLKTLDPDFCKKRQESEKPDPHDFVGFWGVRRRKYVFPACHKCGGKKWRTVNE